MARLKLSEEIAAPVNEVAAFFVPQRMAYWYGVEIQCQLEISGGGADFCAGQKVRVSGALGKHEVSLTAVITRYEWGRLLEWRFQDSAGVRGLQSWELQSRGNATVVLMRDEYEMPGRFARWLDQIFTRHAVVRRDRDAVARLKKLAERR
jgi:hypothetical protein